MIRNLSLIKAKLLAHLNAVDGLTVAYGYEKGQLPSYPAATIYSAEYNPVWADTSGDRDVITFEIRIYQEINIQDPETAETIVDNVLEKIVQALQADYTLGGTCDRIEIRATKGWVSREVQDRAATITVITEKMNRI